MEGLIARAYIRVSTEEQAVSGYSLAAQRERLESFARSQGWTVAGVYEDDGYSAKDTDRPALRQMLSDARSGDVILVYKLDRLTRSVMDLYQLMQTFDTRGLLFKSATEEFNTTTSHGRLMITLVAVLAQWERETIAERVKMGRQKKASTGEWPGGPIPFGYIAQPGATRGARTLKRLAPDPKRAHLVRELFERYLAGQGARKLCLWLNDELGLRTATGARWSVTAVTRLLTNPVYCGDIVHGRRTGGPVTRVAGSHEPLLPRELFNLVQEQFHQRKEMPPRHATGSYPLAGVARCGVCGGPVSAAAMTRRGLYYYRCLNYVKGLGCGPEPFTSIPGPRAEAAAVSLLRSLPQPTHLGAFLGACGSDWASRSQAGSAERKRLEHDLQEAQLAVRRWDQAYETGRLELSDYLTRVQPHKERIKVIQDRLNQANEKPAPPNRETPVSINFAQVWAMATASERKALLLRATAAFGAQIVLGRGRTVRLVQGR